jgi:hypothetical protein
VVLGAKKVNGREHLSAEWYAFKTFVGLFYLKSSPMYDSVFNTRQLNIEAASVGGLFLNLDIWLVAVGYVESHC